MKFGEPYKHPCSVYEKAGYRQSDPHTIDILSVVLRESSQRPKTRISKRRPLHHKKSRRKKTDSIRQEKVLDISEDHSDFLSRKHRQHALIKHLKSKDSIYERKRDE